MSYGISEWTKTKTKIEKMCSEPYVRQKIFHNTCKKVENIRYGPKKCVVVTERITLERRRDDDRPFVYFYEIKTWLVIIKQAS